jgi:hypothetical protein
MRNWQLLPSRLYILEYCVAGIAKVSWSAVVVTHQKDSEKIGLSIS